MTDRPTLADLAAQSNDATSGSDRGLRCPKCGCRDLRVSYGSDVDGGKNRVKRCRHCGTRVLTSETVKRTLPPTGRESNSTYRIIRPADRSEAG